jgi:hypothetical protein
MSKVAKSLIAFAVAVATAAIGYGGCRAVNGRVGNVPIAFHGRVVDDSNAGVPNVRITARVRRLSWNSTPLAPKYESLMLVTFTDAEGRFSFTDARGDFLEIEAFEKVGWRTDDRRFVGIPTMFKYPRGRNDNPPINPEKAVVYPMTQEGNQTGRGGNKGDGK